MQRLNVRQSQIRECIEKSLFAIDQTPHFQKGEILLLQLVKDEAKDIGKLHARIEFALVYDHYEVDHTGDISRQQWPQAGKAWKYILGPPNGVASLFLTFDKQENVRRERLRVKLIE